MLPLLQFAARKETEISTSEAVEVLAKELGLTEDDLREMLPSGVQPTFVNRVGWAATYMKKAGLLETTRRGFYQITDRGRDLLEKQPKTINVELLRQYPEFREFEGPKDTRSSNKASKQKALSETSAATPLEQLEAAYENLRDKLADELLAKLKKVSPAFFEKVVVELLVKMGYGGSRADAGKAIGKSGDGGIDGIIKEDKLGLDVVYIQLSPFFRERVEVAFFAPADAADLLDDFFRVGGNAVGVTKNTSDRASSFLPRVILHPSLVMGVKSCHQLLSASAIRAAAMVTSTPLRGLLGCSARYLSAAKIVSLDVLVKFTFGTISLARIWACLT